MDDRGYDRGNRREDDIDYDRNADRGFGRTYDRDRDRDYARDRSNDNRGFSRTISANDDYSRNRGFDRRPDDRGYSRGYERPSSQKLDRFEYDRGYERPSSKKIEKPEYDRDYDRTGSKGFDRPEYDRGYERPSSKAIDRNDYGGFGNSRGFDRSNTRGFDQTFERGYTTQKSRFGHVEVDISGEEFYQELIKICKTDDVIGRMHQYFISEIGYKPCQLGFFKNIYNRAVTYHRLPLSNDVLLEFQGEDPRSIEWQPFIAKCKTLLSISYDLDEILEYIYQWMRYNGMFSLHEVFKTTEIDIETFVTGCKKAGTNLELSDIHRIFDTYSLVQDEKVILDYDKIEKAYEDKKTHFIAKFRQTDNVDKATIFEAIKNILKIKGCTLRQLFDLESMTHRDEISLYECTKVLVTELNTLGRDFTEGINKFALNHLLDGSKSHISFKSLLDEYEEYYNIEKGTSEVKYRENCIYKMLDRIANKLIYREVDLKGLNKAEFTYDEIEKLVIRNLDIYNQQPPPMSKEEKEDKDVKEKLGIIAEKPKNEEEEKKKLGADVLERKWAPHEITEKERIAVKDTIDYIMDGMGYIKLEDLLKLLNPYLQKQKHSMDVLFRLKQFVKRRHCSLLESFQTYKSYERFKNTELHPEEFLKVLLSIEFEISEHSLYK